MSEALLERTAQLLKAAFADQPVSGCRAAGLRGRQGKTSAVGELHLVIA